MRKKLSKKARKNQQKFVPLTPSPIYYPTFCGFRLKSENVNRLWRWDTLKDVNYKLCQKQN